jgi:RNA polymerase sigma-70 factor (ECF subfamily)
MVASNETLERTYRRYFPMIREKCRRVLGDPSEAQDLAQETFVRLFQHYPTLALEQRSVTAWIYRTATHLAIDRLRSVEPRPLEQATEASTAGEHDTRNPETRLSAHTALVRLAKLLPAADMEVLLLSRVDGLTQREIAEVVGSSERSVRRTFRRLEENLAAWSEELS